MFKHGISTRETPTSVSAIRAEGVVPFYVGTAPVNMGDVSNVNKVVLANTYKEAVEAFGYVQDFENYTLCEAIDAHFSKFGVGPIVMVNVLDPGTHKKNVSSESHPLGANNTIIINKTGILKSSVKLDPQKEFKSMFNDKGELVIVITDSNLESTRNFNITYDYLDPSMITKTDIIGGIDGSTGANKGLECIENVFPKTRLVPTLVLAPKWSTDTTVAAVMETKAKLINGHFKALALTDISSENKKYTDIPGIKEKTNLNSTYLATYYPKVALGDLQYHLSTQVACIIQKLSTESDGIPYQSPSNVNLKADRACLKDGSDVFLAINQANYLNGQGIGTALNWIGGWRAWGNRTSCYPANMDPKDNFISSRMMFNFLNNTLVTNFWNKVDKPTNLNLIKFFKDTINIWLNGLQAMGVLLGGRIEFREEDNPLTSLLDGKVKFKIYYTPPLPLESAEFDCEIDVNYFNNLFA
ncbi:hypothetical protein IX317_001843 [Fusobacterium sp. DD29]|nr:MULTISPECIES: phage tail sheath family protein [unclassified Fusobacterium]MBR8701159.1 hypothetical protein [Fusobacterium sp. DD45]MBR8711328.1 hypothetical protein [Fusobacterium sp. DD28]MBR8750159.1 hypothetical protein [Fusobacterium sp. DD29]MBR8751877.1 hypothetical protein [Fusobacterium sp. DD26]MBR8762401.1 hypothetical protein [Fusobacterium sp. DD25]